jgi:hypothetical protein
MEVVTWIAVTRFGCKIEGGFVRDWVVGGRITRPNEHVPKSMWMEGVDQKSYFFPPFIFVFGFWFLVFGFWLLVFGFWVLVFGFWFLVFGFWFLVFGFWFGSFFHFFKFIKS